MASHSHRPRDERLVIGITGRIGSGKTSVGRYLNSAHVFQYIRYSQVLSDWLATDPEAKAHLQEVGWEVMEGGRQMELNRRLIAQILPNAAVAVDGLRHPVDFESLSNSFPHAFHLLYLESSADDRWERLKGKGRYTDRAIFEAAERHPVEQKIESLRKNAARVISNSESLQALYQTVDAAIRDFLKEGHT
jgi:dephospho-CoA kinase